MKRVLLVGEASFLSTGYSTYQLEFLKRLHATGRYDVMELGGFATSEDARAAALPWKFMSAVPDNPQERKLYDENQLNEFGALRFEEACLRHKPHIVIDIRDWWMFEFQERSPLRQYFHWAIMPTVDAIPQERQWLSTFMNADSVFTYSDWGLDVLNSQSHGNIKTVCAAPPGADLETYEVIRDKRRHRAKYNVAENALIVGTVMRNQKRKLYPDLIEAFATFLKTAPKEIATRTYLHMHTAWPDLGWDIPHLVAEAGIGNRCLFTYYCKSCGSFFPAFFQDSRATCLKCGQFAATFPNSSVGVSRKALNEVFNLWDCYVQYATCEGFGMPQVEAAACGLPVFAVDYSAMSDVVRKIHGFPIRVERLFRESETHRKMALPDNADFVRQLTSFLLKPEPVRLRLGLKARRAVEEHYTWDKTAQRWIDHFDSLELEDRWTRPIQLHTPNVNIPESVAATNEDFVDWGLVNIAGRPDLVGSYTALRMIRDLNWGARIGETMGGTYFNDASTLGIRPRVHPFAREDAVRVMTELAEIKNHWERRRAG